MFGLESGDKNKDFVFDLEKDVEDKSKNSEIIELIERRTTTIKDILRKGTEKEHYSRLATLLHAYISLMKVIERVGQKPPVS